MGVSEVSKCRRKQSVCWKSILCKKKGSAHIAEPFPFIYQQKLTSLLAYTNLLG